MKKILVFENLFEYLSSVNKPNYVSTSTDDLYKSEINSAEFIERPEVGDNIGKSSKEDKKYTIKIRSEIQEGVVEDLMYSGRSFYPDMYTHDRVWANDLAKNGIVSIIDGIMTLKVSPKDLTVFGPNNDIIRYNSEIDSDKVEKMGRLPDNNTKTMKLLKWIGSKSNGATFTEIQHYIFVVLNGNSEEDFWKKDENGLRQTRGYWATALYGASAYHGILPRFCKKINGKWVLDKLPKDDETLYPSIRFF